MAQPLPPRTLHQSIRHIALVTGASRGIGRAIARRLAADNICVALTARTARPGEHHYQGALSEAVDEIRAEGGHAIGIRADLADPSLDRSTIVSEAGAAFGGVVDIIVHNAAAERRFDFNYERMTSALFREAVEVNVWAGWDLARSALAGMRETGGGWILTISSRGAAPRTGPPFELNPLVWGQCLYGGSKAMVDRITTGAAAELYESKIAVNTLAPEGSVATENAVSVAQVRREASEPLETMAEAALALVTGDQSALTGRVAYSLSLLKELGRPVHTLDGKSLLEGWQPHEIDPARLGRPYLLDK